MSCDVQYHLPPRRVKRLNEDDSFKIIVSSGISSVHHVVEELILNAIDAEATTIQISVSITSQSLNIDVQDNG